MKKIIPIWQPVGYSTHIIAKKVSDKFGVKTSHTGTLDPMAEGVIIVLLGEERLKKKEFARWPKRYLFDIAYGISTDTYDGLGIINGMSFEEEDLKDFKTQLKDYLNSLEGKYIQEVPPYSAIKVKGKPLHWYARNKKLESIEIPKRSGEIYKTKLEDLNTVLFKDLINAQLEKISRVTGNLRQKRISNQWKDILNDFDIPKKTLRSRVEVLTSKGIYVRGISQDICKSLNKLGFVSNLIRLSNGKFDREGSFSLQELFGLDFSSEYDFDSRNDP